MGAETISELQAVIGADISKLQSGLDKANSLLEKTAKSTEDSLARATAGTQTMAAAISSGFQVLSGNYSQIGTMLGALPGPIGVVAGAAGTMFGKAIEETIVYTDAMRKASVQTGASVSFISQFVEASDDQFIAQETVTNSLRLFSRALGGVMDMEGNFATGGKGVAEILRDMGIAATDATGKVRPMEELIPMLADKFHEMGPGIKTTGLAIQLFGKQGAEMLPVLLQGSKAMQESMQAAKDMGLAIDEKDVAAVTRLKQAQDALNDSLAAMGRRVSGDVIPALALAVTTINHLTDGSRDLGDALNFVANPTYRLNIVMDEAAKANQKAQEELDKTAQAELEAASGADTATSAINPMIKNLSLLGTIKANEQLERDAVAMWHADEAAKATAKSTEDAAKAQEALATKIGNVGGAIDGNFGKMDKLAQAQAAYKLATGGMTVAEFETEQATKALSKAYVDGKINLADFTKAAKDIATGSPAAVFVAMSKAGGTNNATMVAGVKQLREIEKAVGVGNESLFTYADNLKIVTQAAKPNVATAGQLAVAQTAFDVAQQHANQTMGNAQWHLDNHRIGQEQYNQMQAEATTELNNAQAALDKVKASAGGATSATVASTGATSANAVATQNYIAALAAENVAQEAANKTQQSAKELYGKNAITAEQYAAVQYNGSLVTAQYGDATEKAKKALDATIKTSGATSSVVGKLTSDMWGLGDGIDGIPEGKNVSLTAPADKATAGIDTVKTNLKNIPDNVYIPIEITPPTPTAITDVISSPNILPPEVTMHMFDNFKNAPIPTDDATKIGTDLSAGIAAGIDASTAIARSMTASIDNAFVEVKTAYGIQSPSTVAAETLGAPISLGTAGGITAQAPAIVTALQSGILSAITNSQTWIVSWAHPIGVGLIDGILAGMKDRANNLGGAGTGTDNSGGGTGAGGAGGGKGTGGAGGGLGAGTDHMRVTANIYMGTKQIQTVIADAIEADG